MRDADIVVAATTSDSPVFSGEWLKPGSFVAAVGAYEATMREVDSETIRRASNFVIDSRTDCLDHAGRSRHPDIRRHHTGASKSPKFRSLSPASGRRVDPISEITYYKSIGVPIQDLITAQHMARRAAERGIGIELDIGGDSGLGGPSAARSQASRE